MPILHMTKQRITFFTNAANTVQYVLKSRFIVFEFDLVKISHPRSLYMPIRIVESQLSRSFATTLLTSLSSNYIETSHPRAIFEPSAEVLPLRSNNSIVSFYSRTCYNLI